jgi:hypothetical protein
MSTYGPGEPVAPAAVAVADVARGWVPTRKWIAAQVVALGALAVSAIESGWGNTEWALLVGIIVQGGVTYLLPNELTPGGVPDAKPKVIDLGDERGYGLVEVAVFLLVVVIALVVLFRFL